MSFSPTVFLKCSLAAAVIFASGFGTTAIAQLEDSSGNSLEALETGASEIDDSVLETGASEIDDSATDDSEASGEPSNRTSASIDTATYTDDEISVEYPATWQLKKLDDGIAISSVATTPAELIATQIVRMAAPPGAVVNANIESFTKEGSAVARYSRATIDGQDAFIIWLSDRPDELSSAIATFIGYEDETVLLFSRYAPENIAAEESILAIHTSFTDPAAPAAAAAPAPDSTAAAENMATDEIADEAAEEATEVVPANTLGKE